MISFWEEIKMVVKMIYNYKEIKEKYKNNYKIEKAIKNGEIYKIEKNVYSDTKNVNYLELISKNTPMQFLQWIVHSISII